MTTTADLMKKKQHGEKIAMMTAYDYPTAKMAAESGIDVLLVGDSLGMVVLGYESTVPVTLEDMIHHGKAVRRGAGQAFTVVDMPFGTYHGSLDRTVEAGVRVFRETGADALKLEGAGIVTDAIRRLVTAGIPVVAHLGLLPQSAGVTGGYKVQGKTAEDALRLIREAKEVQDAGACMLVLECIPHQLAGRITKELSIPVIGIGAGAETDGQVLVFHDLIGYGSHHVPKFVRQFADAGTPIRDGIAAYAEAVRKGSFPSDAHRFTMKEEEAGKLYGGDPVETH
ncbi:3-methyl-2-oxobutanoate hydroxymethyltransferase [Bhargavaea cecembensis]|uniref:3-methyl-2-oxobutanoate hydroxymethyltransferase n=1 Tax=Bhargavaea cecembensis TaxID=394098 RepID=A0A161RIT1_9BACL|nr:3-methyl-2-oxobutanoate hydroxymethyltransferase [Bhargavaea cecembensis]KZE38038.1 3-methyl-2-oxobutanoate hydroxymethyltransferase [Bhargavaea cecembensis]